MSQFFLVFQNCSLDIPELSSDLVLSGFFVFPSRNEIIDKHVSSEEFNL